ncbi:oligoendopeptidase F [Azospirillaceae bacterium]
MTSETLPVWSLDDLYPAPDSPLLAEDFARAESAARQFHDRYAGQMASLDGEGLAEAVSAFERIDEVLSRLMSYGQLYYAADMSNPEIGGFYQSLQERVTVISSALVFFTLELNQISEEAMEAGFASSETLNRYRPWLRDIRIYRPHQLEDSLERLLHEKHVVGRAAWNRLFDETVAALRFPIGGQALTCAEALHVLSEHDPELRREAGQSIGRVLGQNIRVFSLITNTLAKDKEIEDQWRRYPRPTSARNLSNRVEDEVVDTLVATVRDSYPSLSHRYYKLKARWMGVERLNSWDRNAPLPDDDARLIPWSEAQAIVLDAYAQFSPKLADIGRRFFDNAWIDAPTRPGKAPGAFAHPTVPSAHPYLLLNYLGRPRDVMTLAHELGHGVHQCLAAQQGHLLAETPLTLAETASVFGEMLTFRALLAREVSPARRRVLLASKVEDMLNTVVRQIAMFDFEQRLHSERRQGELTAERIGALWLETQTESLGPAISFDSDYRHYWSYIPHFVHSPFYVYAYAFGDCLVNALYACYQEAPDGFAERYFALLEAGGTLRHKELLAPFGLDAGDPNFWRRGLVMIGDFIDALEKLG